MTTRIMYVELKRGGERGGPARIERVRFSQSGKVLYCSRYVLEKIREKGESKANYENIQTGDKYWVSGCKKKGGDRLTPGTIEIDDDVREEYWTSIRNMPECVNEKTIKAAGKYGGKQGRKR